MIHHPTRLDHQLIKFAGQYGGWSDLRHLGVMCWMMVGLIAEGSVNLTKWIDHIYPKAQIAQSTQRRLSRWVNNPRINPAKLYSPVVKAVFANWSDPEIYLSFDTSMLWDKYCVSQFPVKMGEAILIHNVQIHKHDSLTDVHLAIAWESISHEHWYLLSTEPTTLQTFREYGLRFTIEENFLDDKSNGFNLESSMLRCAPALSRLCLVLAMTTLFLTATGVEVVNTGQRRLVDPHWFRGSSYLKIGWSWVKKALIHGWNLPHLIFLTSHIDPDPVKASSPKHERRTYSIQFTARTHVWVS